MTLTLKISKLVSLENPIVVNLVTKFVEHEVYCHVDKRTPLDLLLNERIPVDPLEPNCLKVFLYSPSVYS
jgi:hypothetical protein